MMIVMISMGARKMAISLKMPSLEGKKKRRRRRQACIERTMVTGMLEMASANRVSSFSDDLNFSL